jgi:hypothetical protein
MGWKGGSICTRVGRGNTACKPEFFSEENSKNSLTIFSSIYAQKNSEKILKVFQIKNKNSDKKL